MPDKVGYGSPPAEHQWKKGQSGNPRGSKRRDGFFEAAADIFGEIIPGTAGKKKMSTYMVACLRMCVVAIKGDNRALFDMIGLILLHEAEAKGRSAARFIDWAAEAAKFDAQMARMRANRPPPPPDAKPFKGSITLTPAEKRAINREAKRLWKEEKKQREENIRNRGY